MLHNFGIDSSTLVLGHKLRRVEQNLVILILPFSYHLVDTFL